MRHWQACVAHFGIEQDFVLLLAILEVAWKSVSTPNELQVELALELIEGLKDAPETLYDLMILSAFLNNSPFPVTIYHDCACGHFLQFLGFDILISAYEGLKLSWGKQILDKV